MQSKRQKVGQLWDYNKIVNGWVEQEDMEKAEAVLVEMKTAGVNADVITYNTLVNGYCMLKEMEKAEAVLGDMKTAGVKADVVTYTTLVKGGSKLIFPYIP